MFPPSSSPLALYNHRHFPRFSFCSPPLMIFFVTIVSGTQVATLATFYLSLFIFYMDWWAVLVKKKSRTFFCRKKPWKIILNLSFSISNSFLPISKKIGGGKNIFSNWKKDYHRRRQDQLDRSFWWTRVFTPQYNWSIKTWKKILELGQKLFIQWKSSYYILVSLIALKILFIVFNALKQVHFPWN